MPGAALPGRCPRLELYVWYEADPVLADEVQAAFSRLLKAIATQQSKVTGALPAPHTSLPPRLLKRADQVSRPEGPRDTWMEIWPLWPLTDVEAFEAHLHDCADRVGLTALAPKGRHVERFFATDEPLSRNGSVA